MRDARAFLFLSTGVALLALQAVFVDAVLVSGVIRGLTIVGETVLVLAAAKSIAFFLTKSLRNASAAGTINALGAELIVYEAVVLLYLGTGNQLLLSEADQVFQSWLLGVAIFVMPFIIFKIAIAMHQGSSLGLTLPAVVLVSELQLGFLAAASGGALARPGTLYFGRSFMTVVTTQEWLARSQAPDVVTLAAFVAIYISLILYATLHAAPGFRPDTRRALLLSLAGTIIASVWIFESFGLVAFLTLAIVPPTLVMTAAYWLLAHGS
jgi:hypothetical protein